MSRDFFEVREKFDGYKRMAFSSHETFNVRKRMALSSHDRRHNKSKKFDHFEVSCQIRD